MFEHVLLLNFIIATDYPSCSVYFFIDFSSLQIIFEPRTNVAFPICTLSFLLNFCADLLSGRRSRQWHHRFRMFQSLHTPLIFSFAALLRVDIAFLIISLRLLILSSVQGCLRRQGPQHLLNDLIACDAICAQCLDATYPCKMLSATSPLNLHHHLASLEAGWLACWFRLTMFVFAFVPPAATNRGQPGVRCSSGISSSTDVGMHQASQGSDGGCERARLMFSRATS